MFIIAAARRTGKSEYAKYIQQRFTSNWPLAETTCIRVVPNKFADKDETDVYTYRGLIHRIDQHYQTIGIKGSLPKFDHIVFEEPGCYDKEFKQLMEYIDIYKVVLIIGTPTGNSNNAFDEFLILNTNNVIRWSITTAPKEWRLPEELIRTEVLAEYEGL